MTQKVSLSPPLTTSYSRPYIYPKSGHTFNEYDNGVVFTPKDEGKKIWNYELPKTSFPGKQKDYYTKFGNKMRTGDVDPTYNEGDWGKMFGSNGAYMSFKDHYSGDNSCHAYNGTWGVVSESPKDAVLFHPWPVIGFVMDIYGGYGDSGTGEMICVNEMVIHYKDINQGRSYHSVNINPMGKPGGSGGFKFRNSYQNGTQYDVSYNQFKNNTQITAFHLDTIQAKHRMCGFSVSWWIKSGGSDKTYRPRIRYMTPIFDWGANVSANVSNAKLLYPAPVELAEQNVSPKTWPFHTTKV